MVIEIIQQGMISKNKKNILILGSGGHAISCFEILTYLNSYKVIGYVDVKNNINFKLKYLGNDKNLKKIKKKFSYAIIAIGQIKNNKIREKKFNLLKKLDFKLPNIISPLTIVSKNISIGESNSFFHHVIINSECLIGNNNIINSKALIEHETIIGNNNHISTGAIINGNCKIGNNNFIGSGAIINNNIKIGNNCIIGSSTNIKKDIKNNEIIK